MENKLAKLSRSMHSAVEKADKAVSFIDKIADGVLDAKSDVKSIIERDPAATSAAEVILLYSGFHAVAAYRVAHKLDESGHKFTARAISQAAKFFTDIEIHPSARIGKRLFIDHGAGVVIGETAEIGDDCTLGNNVMVGAGAKVLGPFKVGDNTKIAAGAVVLNEIPENSTAVGMPARVVRKQGVKPEDGGCGGDLDQIHIPDPVAQELCRLRCRIEELEKRLDEKEKTEDRNDTVQQSDT